MTSALRPAVYFLLLRGKVVYVGQSKVPLRRFMEHRSAMARGREKAILRRASQKGIVFDEIHLIRCALADLDELEQRYIAQFRPKHNVRHNDAPNPALSLETLIASRFPSLPPTPEPREAPFFRRF